MAAPPPPNQGPPGTPNPQGESQRNNGDPWSQQVPQPIHHGQPPSFVPPGAQYTFAPVLPPNMMMLPRSPAMISSNSPGMMPPNHPTMMSSMPPQPHFPRGPGFLHLQQQQAYEQRLLSLTPQQRAEFHQFSQARQQLRQQQQQQQVFAQPNPLSQQQQHEFVSSQNFQFTQPPNLQMNQPSYSGQAYPNTHFNFAPNVAHRIPNFVVNHPVNLGQSVSNLPLNYPVNQGQPVPPQARQSSFDAFARQVVHDMNTQSVEEFIHGRRPQAPILIQNRPIFQHPQQQAPNRPISQSSFPKQYSPQISDSGSPNLYHPQKQAPNRLISQSPLPQQHSPHISNLGSPNLYHPQPRPSPFQRASPATIFGRSPATTLQHRRRRSSNRSNLSMEMGESSTSGGTMGGGPGQRGNLQRNPASDDSGYKTREQTDSIPPTHGTTVVDAEPASLEEQRQSAAVLDEPFGTGLPPTGMATPTPRAAATRLAQSPPQPLQQEPAGDDEDPSVATLAEIDPSDQAADVVDGFFIPDDDDDEDWGNTNVDDLVGVLDGYLGISEQAEEGNFNFPQAATQQFSAEVVRKSVPFMKATIYPNILEADLRSSVGPHPATGPRTVWMSHGNRQLRWFEYAAQYKQDVALDINQFRLFPDKVPPNSDEYFHLYPNPGRDFMRDFHKDTAAIDRIPSAGQPSQYLPHLISTEMWYNSIINLQDNIDLWLPMPLLHMMSFFYDTPYCIANLNALEIKVATLPGRPCEFTEPEATTLMTFTMERYRAGIDNELVRDWKLYRAIFQVKYKWAPTVERMRVLDLMLQIDFVYFLQGLGKPLHPWTKYYQNKIREEYGQPTCPITDGP